MSLNGISILFASGDVVAEVLGLQDNTDSARVKRVAVDLQRVLNMNDYSAEAVDCKMRPRQRVIFANLATSTSIVNFI